MQCIVSIPLDSLKSRMFVHDFHREQPSLSGELNTRNMLADSMGSKSWLRGRHWRDRRCPPCRHTWSKPCTMPMLSGTWHCIVRQRTLLVCHRYWPKTWRIWPKSQPQKLATNQWLSETAPKNALVLGYHTKHNHGIITLRIFKFPRDELIK